MRSRRLRFLPILALLLLGSSRASSAHPDGSASSASSADPLAFREVVAVRGATRDGIYGAALVWFSGRSQESKEPFEQNRLARVLIDRGSERYVPPFLANACSGWIRYRVTLAAREGRYLCTIDDFVHVGDRNCQKRSFGLLTSDWLTATIRKTFFDMGLQPTKREDQDRDVWLDLRGRAATINTSISASLRARVAGAASRPPGS
ncbi:MAG TPA: hypothetical protein VIA45_09960 [Thermoanaerobaculia bacterium]